MTARRTETGRVHLEIFGEEHQVELEVEVGPIALSDLIGVAHRLSGAVTDIVVQHASARGEHPSCKAGCGACCRSQVVPVSVVEAVALARLVDALPEPRRSEVRDRFSAAVRRLTEAGLHAPSAPTGRHSLVGASWDEASRRYFDLGIACPFLEDESCSIHPERPSTCREYLVTTPAAWCERLDERVASLERPVRLSEALGDAATELAGAPVGMIPLTLALVWTEHHGAVLDRPVDGEEAFGVLMTAAQKSHDE